MERPEIAITLTDFLERLEELAQEAGVRLPRDLQPFEVAYYAGERPVDALEDWLRQSGDG